MPRRELLTPAERESLLTVPVIEAEQIRQYTLSRGDLAFIRQHRWDYNRLGVAIQHCYLRYPGRVLARRDAAGGFARDGGEPTENHAGALGSIREPGPNTA